jgi:hypothetical protein
MTNDKLFFTEEEWKRVPLKLRQKFWDDTNYAKRPPSEELLAEIRTALQDATKENP